MSNILSEEVNEKSSVINISDHEEKFLKEFLRNFHQKIIDIEDFNTFENTLKEWIKNSDKNIEKILKLMKNHKENEFWFSSIIGFFYQYGIGCDINKDKSLELYLLSINNDKFLNQKFSHLEKIDKEFFILQDINIIIGKYLLSFFIIKILF
jgi:hypothetical protein